MRKIICGLLAFILLMGCAAYGEETVDILGEWYMSLQGVSIQFALEEDNTYSASFEGNMMAEGGWEYTENGVKLLGLLGADLEFAIGENIMSGVGDAEGLELTREAPAAYMPAELRTDAALEDYAGVWSSEYMKYGEDQYFSPQISEMGMYIQIDGTHFEMIASMGWAAVYELFPNRAPGSFDMDFENGVMHYEESKDGVPIFNVTLTMMEDGGMRMDIYNKNLDFDTEYEEEMYFYPCEMPQT